MRLAVGGLFVERGYERTTIRAIAGAARVDGGLVMYYFGSKQGLFQRVTHARPAPELSGSAEQVTEQILARLAESLASEPVHSLALLRSMLTHPQAAQAMQEGAARVQAQISWPIHADDADIWAPLVSAVWLGVIVSQHLLASDALTAASPQQVIATGLSPTTARLTASRCPAASYATPATDRAGHCPRPAGPRHVDREVQAACRRGR